MANLLIRRTKVLYSTKCGFQFRVDLEITSDKVHPQKIDVQFEIPSTTPCDFVSQNKKNVGQIVEKSRAIEPGWQIKAFFIGFNCKPEGDNFEVKIVAFDEDKQCSNEEQISVSVTC